MNYRIGYTRRAWLSLKKGMPAMQHAHSGGWRDKKRTTAMAMCGAPLEPPADAFMEPTRAITFGVGNDFDPSGPNACLRCRRRVIQ